MRLGVTLSICLLALGCAPEEPPEDQAVVVSPVFAPPPAYSDSSLSRDEALAVCRRWEEPGDAVRQLDRHPFEFELNEAALAWFGEQGLDPTVLDYLRKRAKVDWSSLRGDVDPETPR